MSKIRSKIQAGVNAEEDESLLSQSKDVDPGACTSNLSNCKGTTVAEAEKVLSYIAVLKREMNGPAKAERDRDQ